MPRTTRSTMPKHMETVDYKELWVHQEFGKKTMWMCMVRTWLRTSMHNNMDPWNKSKTHSIQFNQPEVVMSNSEVTGLEQMPTTVSDKSDKRLSHQRQSYVANLIGTRTLAVNQQMRGTPLMGFCKSQRIRAGKIGTIGKWTTMIIS